MVMVWQMLSLKNDLYMCLRRYRVGVEEDSVHAQRGVCGRGQGVRCSHQRLLQTALCVRLQMWRLLPLGGQTVQEYLHGLRQQNRKYC